MITDHGRELFKQSLINFREHPEAHKQETWICGTGCCIAGSIVQLDGATPIFFGPERSTNLVRTKDGAQQSVGWLAEKILGLDGADREILFSADNTIDDLEAMYRILDAGDRLSGQCEHGWGSPTTILLAELPHRARVFSIRYPGCGVPECPPIPGCQRRYWEQGD